MSDFKSHDCKYSLLPPPKLRFLPVSSTSALNAVGVDMCGIN